ncbi:hypothetical protein AAFF_G00053400 [Aldrovandia affinis]|uniref:Reverse transcriptase/retrotransposon-derived protein RNase H-like domain-containing protein n=1 Tax=Aldrovandia affinis TaxID=143900 RepID=A0AAD7T4W4_9TELE|nr:hypothetical protein AAFF_G00053400 [Aldrovandia affinis]
MEEGADRLAVVRGIWERSCGHLEPEQQEELWQLLTEFKGIFALTDAEIGRTHLVHHQIDTGDARPIRSPPRRLPMAYREAAECAIDEMQHAGIIEPSASPWASGVVMVKKKNTSKMRFCVDYRPLNKVTKKDSYPMPHVDEALDTVAGSSWFSSLDLHLSLPFVLDTDASNLGMGAVLSQVGPEGERAVAYFSHTFNKAERNYCVTRRELLAVVKAVRHFSHRTPRTLSVPEQQQHQVALTGATRPRRRRRPPGRFEDFV